MIKLAVAAMEMKALAESVKAQFDKFTSLAARVDELERKLAETQEALRKSSEEDVKEDVKESPVQTKALEAIAKLNAAFK